MTVPLTATPVYGPLTKKDTQKKVLDQFRQAKMDTRDKALTQVFFNSPQLAHHYVDTFQLSQASRLKKDQKLSETLEAFFAEGVAPNGIDKEGTPLVSKLLQKQLPESTKTVIQTPSFQANLPDSKGKTPLMLALMQKSGTGTIEALLSKGARVIQTDPKTKEVTFIKDNLGLSALDYAQNYGRSNVIKKLLDQTENLLTAEQKREITEETQAQKQTINDLKSLSSEYKKLRTNTYPYLHPYPEIENPPSPNRQFADIIAYSEAGMDLNQQEYRCGHTLLSVAVETNNLDIIKAFILTGANLDLPDKNMTRSPLTWAAIYGEAEAARLLIDGGANINHLSKGFESPLDAAQNIKKYTINKPEQQAGQAKIAELLKQKGAVDYDQDKLSEKYGSGFPISYSEINGNYDRQLKNPEAFAKKWPE